MRVLLTSTGLENEKFKKIILNWCKDIKNKKAIFIPTAATFPDAIEVLPKCLNDLISLGINKDNILVYDLCRKVNVDEIKKYDIIYLCGGDPYYLLDRINDSKFNLVLKEMLNNNKIMIGVSAGSIVAAQNIDNNLNLLNCILEVHCNIGSKIGEISVSKDKTIKITNNQAVLIEDKNVSVIE